MTSSTQHPAPVPQAVHPDADLGFELAKPARVSAGRLFAFAAVGAVVLGSAFAVAYLPKRAARQELEQAASERVNALPRMTIVKPRLLSSERQLSLPGSVQPLEEAVIYPRASGYISRWLVDIGAHVKADQLLAEIDTPELDQELAQARASLAQADANVLQAQANKGLAATQLDRTAKLVDAGLSPQQDLDSTKSQVEVRDADLKVAFANVNAQRANIRRLNDLKAFSRVLAPFAGTITQRLVDRGSLVAEGSTATPLFRLASTDTVRVFVNVPQDAAPSIVLDAPAELFIREFPNEKFEGKVARTSGALDQATRTLSTEVWVVNGDGRLLSGMYAEVRVKLASERHVYELPATALLNDASGIRLAIVDQDDKIHLQPVVLERDLGATVQIASGIQGNERIVQVASADLTEGQKIAPVVAPMPAASANAAAPPAPSALTLPAPTVPAMPPAPALPALAQPALAPPVSSAH